MGLKSRWAPSALGSACWGRLRSKFKSETRVACKYDHHDEASTTASLSETSSPTSSLSEFACVLSEPQRGVDTVCDGSRTPSEFDSLTCGASIGSLIGENIPGVPHSFTRQHSPVAGSTHWTMKDFEIVKALGDGSMGSVRMVKLAHGRSTARYALKIIDKRHVVMTRQVARVMQEKQLLGLVNHPFVVKLAGTFQDDARLFLLMELAGGGDLYSALGSGKFDDACANFFAAEITLAIGHLHSLDIAYRDLKPENVAIDSLGHAKIIDFGLAKVVEARTYTVCGTSEYMAPEVLTHVGHGSCVDWWALGILIFEMLSFRFPFTGRTAAEIHKSVVFSDPRCPPYFGSATKGIVYLLLIKDQTLRLGSGADGGGRVQRHPWFSPVDWDDLLRRRCTSPFTPNASGDAGPPARGGSAPGAGGCGAPPRAASSSQAAPTPGGVLSEGQHQLVGGL